MSPWAIKRLQEFGGDISRFRVVRIQPSVLRQIAIAKTEPGDENNQDISSLVGKVDIRKLDRYSQNDPDAYSYSGGLCLANQGLLEFVEMFKAPIKMLHPLLTATQEGNYKGTEGFSAIPFNGIILAHSNESEWQTFRNNKQQRGVPRPHLHRQGAVLPAGVRGGQDLPEAAARKLARRRAVRAGHARDDGAVLGADAPEGAGELEHLLEDARLRRREPEGRRSQGEGLPGVPRLRRRRRRHERDLDALRVQDPVLACSTTTRPRSPPIRCTSCTCSSSGSRARTCPRRRSGATSSSSRATSPPRYAEFIGKEIQTAYLESYSEYGQNIFDRYVTYADCWLQDEDFRDPETGESLRPRGAQRRAGEDREGRRHRQPEGLPQRDRQLRAARARQQRRQEPGVDQLREAARGDREEDVLEHRGPAAGDLVQRQGLRRRPGRSTRTSSRAWSPRATPRSRCGSCASGTCACASRRSGATDRGAPPCSISSTAGRTAAARAR